MISSIISILSLFRVIVLPVQFQDCGMTADSTSVSMMLQEASDYFTEQTNDTVSFELGPVTTLPKTLKYYGKNVAGYHDEKMHEAVVYACRNVQNRINFAEYDNSGDGKVECVVILTAGLSESDGNPEEYIWPQQNKLSNDTSPLIIANKTVNDYLVITELWSKAGENARLTGIGTLCHEFGHIIGLVDYYDTDGIASGGLSTAMWGTTALMDEGNFNNEGRTPPYLNAVDCWLLGLGECEELAEGTHTLPPMGGKGGKYMKYETGHEGEFYLFEARNNTQRDAYIGGRGLLVYHIDRSVPTYLDRWKDNRVNCYPDHQCAHIISADPNASSASGAFFPHGEITAFTPLPLALTGISVLSDGSVSFNVFKPFKSTEITAYQDAATVCWELDKSLSGLPVTLICGEAGAEPDTIHVGNVSSYTIERLKPDTKYSLKLLVEGGGPHRYSSRAEFTTKVYFKDTLPFILLSGAERNDDGSFVKGTGIPLRVYNIRDVEDVKWYFNGSQVRTDSDGRFILDRNGTLKAVVSHTSESHSVLIKEIIVR